MRIIWVVVIVDVDGVGVNIVVVGRVDDFNCRCSIVVSFC